MAVEYYNDLALSLNKITSLLENGVTDRDAPSHHPIVASIGPDGAPQQRVMILRHVDWDMRHLRFNTDARSHKVDQISENSSVSILVYDELEKIQIRINGKALIDSGANADAAWAGSTPFARRCYMAEAGPGTPAAAPSSGLPTWIEGKKPQEDQLIKARENFAILTISFDQIDWLYLANDGHRRASFRWSDESWLGQWLIP